MEFVVGILFLIVVGVLIDMARGRKPEFKLHHGQKLKAWGDEPNSITGTRPDAIGPGRFKLSGVDKATRMDVTEYVHADSPDNAKAKVELGGVVVTKVDRD